MPKPSINTREDKTPELIAAEAAGNEALRRYCRERQGRATELARKSGLLISVLSKMANKGRHINLEAAALIEVATDGELRAETLCPSRADTLQRLLDLRKETA